MLRSRLAELAAAFGLLTRLPLGILPQPADAAGYARAAWAWPLAGAVVGAFGGGTQALLTAAGLPPGLAAPWALAAMLLASGALHEDGLADTADGFGGGRDRDRKLEIMRDSRVGTYGVATLALSILLRWSALSELAGVAQIFSALIAAHAASRALIPGFMHFLPSARTKGLAADAGAPSAEVAVIGAVIGAIALLLLGLSGAVAVAALLALWFLILRWLCLAQIGGHTGDTVGALQQGAEILVLLAASAILV